MNLTILALFVVAAFADMVTDAKAVQDDALDRKDAASSRSGKDCDDDSDCAGGIPNCINGRCTECKDTLPADYGGTCTDTCSDFARKGYCERFWSGNARVCKVNYTVTTGPIKNNCRLSCNHCVCNPECENGGTCQAGVCQCTSTYVGPSCGTFVENCANILNDASCDFWEKEGHCTNTYAEYMETNCKKSCGYCTGGGGSSSNTECDPYTEEACRDASTSLGLSLGGSGYAFAGNWPTKGCYAYSSTTFIGNAYYSTGGTMDQMKTVLVGSKYRPVGYDCSNA